MPTEMIRPVREEDAVGFHRAYDLVARERKYLSATEGPPLERTREFISRNIASQYPQFVVAFDDEVVGWCDIIPMSLPAHRHAGTLGMGLLPECRGQGLGLKLIEATLEAARRFGLLRVELSVHADNLPAIALYRRVGFEQEGIKKSAVLMDGMFKDLVMMALVERANRSLPRHSRDESA